jgi:hypothetical protein
MGSQGGSQKQVASEQKQRDPQLSPSVSRSHARWQLLDERVQSSSTQVKVLHVHCSGSAASAHSCENTHPLHWVSVGGEQVIPSRSPREQVPSSCLENSVQTPARHVRSVQVRLWVPFSPQNPTKPEHSPYAPQLVSPHGLSSLAGCATQPESS